MYAPKNTRSDGGYRNLSGLGMKAVTIDDAPNGGGGFYWVDDAPLVLENQPPPIGNESLSPTPALAFNPPQGQVVVVTRPGQTPRVVVQRPGVYVDTSRIGQPPAPSVENTIADFTDWLQRNTIFAAVPNWVVLAGGVLAFNMLGRGKN